MTLISRLLFRTQIWGQKVHKVFKSLAGSELLITVCNSQKMSVSQIPTHINATYANSILSELDQDFHIGRFAVFYLVEWNDLKLKNPLDKKVTVILKPRIKPIYTKIYSGTDKKFNLKFRAQFYPYLQYQHCTIIPFSQSNIEEDILDQSG